MTTRRPSFQPVRYDESALALWKACDEYLNCAKAASSGPSFEPPEMPKDALIALPDSGMKAIRTSGEDRFHLGWPFVAIKIDDTDHPGDRKERHFDPWFFVAMQLFAIAGCRLGLRHSKKIKGEPDRLYAEYQQRHQLRRIIVNTPAGCDTRERHPTAKRDRNGRGEAHYDYRRITLFSLPKPKVRTQGHLTRAKSRRREDAIVFAVDMLRLQKDHHTRVGTAAPPFSPDEFEQRLRAMLKAADNLHERMAKHAADLK